jgi:class 3 adenylate cyclase
MPTVVAVGVSVFMLSDIERSTQLWSADSRSMSVALRVHDRIARAAVERAGGQLVKHTCDGFLARFDAVGGAIESALDVQRDLGASQEAPIDLRVRMAVLRVRPRSATTTGSGPPSIARHGCWSWAMAVRSWCPG